MSLPNPLLKRVRTEDHVYVYSGKTGRIFHITEAMSDILELYGKSNKGEIITKLAERHPVSDLEEGLNIIDHLNRERGHFAPGGFETRIKRITEAEVVTELNQGIRSICLEVTEACNLRCKYCVYSGGYRYTRTHGAKHMNLLTAKAAIDLLNARHHGVKEGSPSIGFYGGEPLLRFDFIKRCVEYAKSLKWDIPFGVNFNLTTNGTLLTEETIEFLLDHDVTPTISLDGPQSEHDRSRVFPNGQGSFVRVFENVKHLRTKAHERNCKVSVLFNCVESPCSDLIKLHLFFIQNARDDLITDLLVTSVTPGHQTFFQECPQHPKRQQQTETLYQVYHKAHLHDFDPHAPENIFIRQLFEKDYLDLYKRDMCSTATNRAHLTRMCFPGRRRPFVSVDGHIHVCERINDTLPIGDVWRGFDTGRITELWNQFAEIADMEGCRTCWAVRLCSLCLSSVAGNGELSAELKRSICESTRQRWARVLRDYCRLKELNPAAFDYMETYLVM